MLQITTTAQSGLLILSLDGELALETVDQFTMAMLNTRGADRIILDCQRLLFVDSTGVNAMLQAALAWRRDKVHVLIENLSAELNEMLDILGFFEVLAQ